MSIPLHFSIRENICHCGGKLIQIEQLKKVYKPLFSTLFLPERDQKVYTSGRSSDLLLLLRFLPGLSSTLSQGRGQASGCEYCAKVLCRAYSSGSVQDLHLIPFSSFISEPFEMNNTKIQGKDRLFFWDLFNKFVKMTQECC
ncbi:hypothetical protein SAMN05216331_12641 [Porphyromonadaceae bacterium KH3R12]|nr:hypothetical protein SAMN05216331_12641 [Porphyromonadaceae bacterium KH3R12]